MENFVKVHSVFKYGFITNICLNFFVPLALFFMTGPFFILYKYRYMKLKYLVLIAVMHALMVLAACSKDDPELPVDDNTPITIVFNEIHTTGNPDWIEIFNYGDEDVDLEGFVVFDREESKYTLPGGHIVKSGDFIILYCDDQGVGLNLPFKLTSLGEVITLHSPGGKTIDKVTFPPMDVGQTYARFPDGDGAWQVTGFATQGASNGAGPISSFKSYGYTPEIPMVGDEIVFLLEISNTSDVASIELFYAIDEGAYNSLIMTSSDDINYNATVPALQADGELYYYFKLTDAGGSEVLLPNDALEDPYDITITSGELPRLLINEFMASNTMTLADPDGLDEYDDWIEIYNAGSTPVDMGRFYFSDSEDPFDDRIPPDAPDKTTIQPGEYLIYWADSDTEQGPNHLKFRLSINGETISLYYKDGRLIDSHSFGVQSSDVSEGRSPDGSDNWVKFNTPTPGSANQ